MILAKEWRCCSVWTYVTWINVLSNITNLDIFQVLVNDWITLSTLSTLTVKMQRKIKETIKILSPLFTPDTTYLLVWDHAWEAQVTDKVWQKKWLNDIISYPPTKLFLRYVKFKMQKIIKTQNFSVTATWIFNGWWRHISRILQQIYREICAYH